MAALLACPERRAPLRRGAAFFTTGEWTVCMMIFGPSGTSSSQKVATFWAVDDDPRRAEALAERELQLRPEAREPTTLPGQIRRVSPGNPICGRSVQNPGRKSLRTVALRDAKGLQHLWLRLQIRSLVVAGYPDAGERDLLFPSRFLARPPAKAGRLIPARRHPPGVRSIRTFPSASQRCSISGGTPSSLAAVPSESFVSEFQTI